MLKLALTLAIIRLLDVSDAWVLLIRAAFQYNNNNILGFSVRFLTQYSIYNTDMGY